MARFDVYRVAGAYLLDCQADVLSYLGTRFVVPLLPVADVPRAERLNPVFAVEGEDYVMATQLALAIPAQQLRGPIASLANDHGRIISAFDMLLTGY